MISAGGTVVRAVPVASRAAPPTSGTTGQEFKPGLDDLMTMLIQPRHIRLYFAGMHSNWELAASEARDLRAAFSRIAVYIPKYLGVGVDEALGAMIAPRLQGIDAAIAGADVEQFAKAYENLTVGCNACHSYMEHPFHVVKVPNALQESVFADQDFGLQASPHETK